MNRALWLKSIREGQWLLLGSALLLFAFHWINVWLVSQVQTGYLRRFVRYFMTPMLEKLIAVPIDVLISPAGRIAAGFDYPLVIVTVMVWAIARGSDSVSGEINRGTMEVLLAQPVRRGQVLLAHAGVTTLGLALLALACWLGVYVGVSRYDLEEISNTMRDGTGKFFKAEMPVSPQLFWPAAVNLFALGFFIAGLTTLLSSFDRYRSRTIGIVVAVFLVAAVLKLVAISGPTAGALDLSNPMASLIKVEAPNTYGWLKYLTFLTVFEPQWLTWKFWPPNLAKPTSDGWKLLWQYNGLLIGLGLLWYAAATVVFCRRDLPAPL